MPLCLRLLFSRFSPGSRDVFHAFVFLLVGIVSIAALLGVLIQLPQVPFNVRELFGSQPMIISLPIFAAYLIWMAGTPNITARITIICPMIHLLQPLILLLLATPSWFLLRLSVSSESLIDVLGTPTMGWSGDWELFVRYLALTAPFLLSLFYWNLLLEGSAWLSRKFGLGQMLAALLVGLPLLWLAKYIVVDRAATTNIVDLTAQGPSWRVGGALALTIALITLNGALLAWMWLWNRAHQIGALVATPILFGLSWLLLNQGFNMEAISFLLGPDYNYVASVPELLARWAIVYGASVALIAFAHLIPFRLRGSAASQRQALSTGTFPHVRRPQAAEP